MDEKVINYPPWIIVSPKGKLSVNEVEFCKMFLQTRDLKCIGGQFRDIHREVDENEIRHEIAEIIMQHIEEGVSSKVKSVTETLKLRCYSESPEVSENEIHLLNGVLRTNGDFSSELRFCINRLNADFDVAAPPPEKFISSFCYNNIYTKTRQTVVSCSISSPKLQ